METEKADCKRLWEEMASLNVDRDHLLEKKKKLEAAADGQLPSLRLLGNYLFSALRLVCACSSALHTHTRLARDAAGAPSTIAVPDADRRTCDQQGELAWALMMER